ncbi:unnamed protein product [Phyllotreta striolata]|uniref:Ubiquitin-like domain-containing protein n=1 Tax=Phyllotreta striolata TaxID=444603 RepID=A0A9N9TSR6_PHYSR|nr:unnamed protein product [Phyllotreta striolata]
MSLGRHSSPTNAIQPLDAEKILPARPDNVKLFKDVKGRMGSVKMPSLLEALEQKYGESSTDSDGSEDEGISVSIFVPCKSPRAVVPALLVLNDCDIATAGEKEALIAKCASVEELDLAKNKLQEWPEVFGILEQMPRLKFVNLSFNVLSTPLKSEVELDKGTQWQQLKSLVLNSTYISWDSVQEILDHLPNLEELHLSLNDYNDVRLQELNNCDSGINDNEVARSPSESEDAKTCSCPPKPNHKHTGLRVFHFNGNPVEDWKEVVKIGYAFPNLQTLVLADCPIRTLDVDEDLEEDGGGGNMNYERTESQCTACTDKCSPHGGFQNLKIINMNSTNISTWNDVEKLAKFPKLECVRIQACPIWESNEYTEHERRQLLIARLPNAKTLNGGSISTEEREDAERAFIRYYMDKPESDQPERFFELIQIHGKLDPLVKVDLRPEKRVKVTFTCGENSETRPLDLSRTVWDLKVKLEGFAGFSASKMRLFYVDQDLRDFQGPELMKFPNKRLYSYNIRNGDEIIIDCKKKPTAPTTSFVLRNLRHASRFSWHAYNPRRARALRKKRGAHSVGRKPYATARRRHITLFDVFGTINTCCYRPLKL